jgi:SAM-dependent methyltransferase
LRAVPPFLKPTRESAQLIDASAQVIKPASGLERWYPYYCQTNRSRLAIDFDLVRAFVDPSANVLEVGAVPLVLMLALQSEGYRMTGVDLDPSRFAQTIADQKLNVVSCDIESEALPFADQSFDALLLNEVFEHLRINLIFTLSEIHRVLGQAAHCCCVHQISVRWSGFGTS